MRWTPGRKGRRRCGCAWLWTSVGGDAAYFHIDASRSAEAAQKLFAGAMLHTVIVCDHYSACKKLARLRGGLVTLTWCWAHQRRDFIKCAAGQVRLTAWRRAWLERSALIYRLNEARLTHYDPGLKSQPLAFDAAQGALAVALDSLFADAERELADLPDRAREGKALRSLVNHRKGLSVFVDRPQVPLDNNLAERLLRGPAIGRRLSFGSDSAGMTGDIMCRYHGRDFTAGEMALLRALIAGPAALNRHALSKEFCRRIGWFKPNGGLKDMMARVTMLAMHKDGLITLPPPKWRQNRPGLIVFGPDTEPPPFPAPTTLDEVSPLDLRTVVRGSREGKL